MWPVSIGYDIFSNRVLISSSGGQPERVAVAYIGLLESKTHLTNSSPTIILSTRLFIWQSSPSSLPVILMFVLFIVFQISWMFCVRRFLDLTSSLTNTSISSVPNILFSISCILLMMLTSVISYLSPRFSISRFASICASLLFPLPFLGPGLLYSIPSPVWLCFPLFL